MPENTNTAQEEMIQQAIERFWETFPPVWDLIRAHVRSIAFEQFNISVAQFQILRLIRRGRASVSELAEIKQISRSAISQAVDILVGRGLIIRHQNSEDRRCYKLLLTDEGSELLSNIYKQNRVWMSEKMISVSSDESLLIMQGLDILKRSFIEK